MSLLDNLELIAKAREKYRFDPKWSLDEIIERLRYDQYTRETRIMFVADDSNHKYIVPSESYDARAITSEDLAAFHHSYSPEHVH